MNVKNGVAPVPEKVITALLYKPTKPQSQAWRNLASETEGWFYPADLNELVEYPTHVPRVRQQLVKEGYAELKTIKTTDNKGRPVEKIVIRLKRDKLTFLKLWLWAIRRDKNGTFMDSDYFSSNPAIYTPLLIEYACEFLIPRNVINEAKKKGQFKQLEDKFKAMPEVKSVNTFKAFPAWSQLVYFQPGLFNLYYTNRVRFQFMVDDLKTLFGTAEEFLLYLVNQGVLNYYMEEHLLVTFKYQLINFENIPGKLDQSKMKERQESERRSWEKWKADTESAFKTSYDLYAYALMNRLRTQTKGRSKTASQKRSVVRPES